MDSILFLVTHSVTRDTNNLNDEDYWRSVVPRSAVIMCRLIMKANTVVDKIYINAISDMFIQILPLCLTHIQPFPHNLHVSIHFSLWEPNFSLASISNELQISCNIWIEPLVPTNFSAKKWNHYKTKPGGKSKSSNHWNERITTGIQTFSDVKIMKWAWLLKKSISDIHLWHVV